MPRIYDSRNDPHDFCLRCFPPEGPAFRIFGGLGDGPDGRGNCFGYDAEHPDYADDDYRCDVCHKRLTSRDDYQEGR